MRATKKLTSVILNETIRKLGSFGDVVSASRGFVRNYLIPHKKAIMATEANLKVLEGQRQVIKKQQDDQLQIAKKVQEKLVKIDVLPIFSNVSKEGKLFGSVSIKDITDALLEKEIEVSAKNIVLAGHIKKAGEHDIKIFLHPEVTHTLKVHILDLSRRTSDS